MAGVLAKISITDCADSSFSDINSRGINGK